MNIKNYMKVLVPFILLMHGIGIVHAQIPTQQELSKKMNLHSKVNTSVALFVHFDKTIYTNNETVWFTGYLLNANLEELSNHSVMSVALVRDVDSTIVLQEKYYMGKGFSFGSMVLPDSMITGNYHFQVTTNRVSKGKPDVSFIQSVVIKTNIDSGNPTYRRQISKGVHTAIHQTSDNKRNISILTDREVYTQRQKVTIRLKLTGNDTLGIVSVACVQNNRILASYANNIIDYSSKINRNNNREMVSDTILNVYDSLPIKIKVTNKNDKPLKKPVDLVIMGMGVSRFGSTDVFGELELKNEDIITEYGKKISVYVSGKGNRNYTIKIIDPYEKLNKKYTSLFGPDLISNTSTISDTSDLVIPASERFIRLKEVSIVAKTDDLIYAHERGRSECGDYLCGNKHLNCPGLSPAAYLKPKNGDRYRILGYEDTWYTYTECKKNEFSIQIPGIYTKKEFYADEYRDELETAFVSTLYWNHCIVLNSKEQEFSFYTGDITGRFRIVVQGMTNNDLIYGQHFFEVKAKPNN